MSMLWLKKSDTGCLDLLSADMAEKTPVEPDPVNTGEGMSAVLARGYVPLIRTFAFLQGMA